jgi:hypothetical protein
MECCAAVDTVQPRFAGAPVAVAVASSSSTVRLPAASTDRFAFAERTLQKCAKYADALPRHGPRSRGLVKPRQIAETPSELDTSEAK